ncbi:hypothetical protein [Brasilonema sp. UFV-L1]|uniref:hypothetical protein n=1 Tax=Brasilonema sp. UFV-L1 TaxID=2234130 RepID=UPI00145D41D4|nr:hypothetical protein [Brasilonema sp. UFV-L1]NMG11949.1 hypothetical protein [Brasilonema sp. UFV-L1]
MGEAKRRRKAFETGLITSPYNNESTNKKSEQVELLKDLEEFATISRLEQKIQKQKFESLCESLERITEKTPVEVIALELFKMSLMDKNDVNSFNRSPFLSNIEKTRKLGEELNQAGGLDLMRAVGTMVPAYDQRELDYAWNGIGGWLA